MGQTLTHGIYLPDEGERNCYNGLASNWSILDGAVGTIAEHTTALAGKAPAVHTHTKSDVTDLFNSANTWSASNTYNAGNAIIIQNNNVSRGSEPSSYQEQQLKWSDTDGNEIARIRYLNQLTSAGNIANGLEFSTTDKFKDGVRDPTGSIISATFRIGLWNDGTKYVYNECRWRSNLLPFGNNTNDIGSSSYQWNNVYSKNYYYNGVAWGLDKDNHWKRTQVLNADTIIDIVNNPSNETVGPALYWKDNARFWAQYIPVWGTDGSFRLELGISNYHSNGSQGYWTIVNKISKDFGTFDFYTTHGAANLGTSTYKWKTFNGVNPGALSLPNSPGGTGTVNVNYYDLSGNITIRDGSGENIFTASCDGWIAIQSSATWLQISNDTLLIATTAAIGTDGFAQAFLPVRKGNAIRVIINQTNTAFQSFKLLPCEGNV